jgi:type I restriction enzyme S subunit
MSEWKEYKLGEVAEVQTGPFGSQLHMSDYKMVGTPIITVEHLGENKILHNNLPLVGDDDRNRLIKYTLKVGDIVFSRVGSVDRRAYVNKNEDGWMFSGRCLRVRANDKLVNQKYLSFYFGQESFKETIRMVAVGATMPSINTTILSEIEVTLPPLPEQTAIAEVLSSLDDKIDLLHRQNKTLEQLAETLFRQWFVEEAEGSWGYITLGESLELVYGKTLKEEQRSGTGFPVLGSNGVIGYHSEYVTQGPGIVIGRKGTLGKVNYVFDNFYPIDTTYYVRSRINSVGLFYEYFLLKQLNMAELNSDSAVPGLNRDIAHSIEINNAPVYKIHEYNGFCSPLFQKIKSNTHQIRTLTHLRDTLLPKLMNGEIRLNQDFQDEQMKRIQNVENLHANP